MKIWILFPLLFLIIFVTKAQSPAHPKVYFCLETNSEIQIDGKLNEKAWEKASWTTQFADIENPDSLAPLITKVKLLWDNQFLYIGAYLEEPHIWSEIEKDESIIYVENDFEVFIDPNGDNHLYAEYEFNALNTKWDLLLNRPYRDGGDAVFGWNSTGLKHATHLEGSLNDPTDIDSCWTMEIAIPLKDIEDLIKRKPKTNSTSIWRINFSRVQWEIENIEGRYVKIKKPEYNWVWSPQWKINMHRPEYWGYLLFVDKHSDGKEMKFKDTFWEEKINLMTIYEAQKRYKRIHGCFSQELLLLSVPSWINFSGVEINSTCDQFYIKSGNFQVNHLGRLWER